MQNIEDIANQCVLSGGRGVYLARALAIRFGVATDWDDESLCAVGENRSAGTNDRTTHWTIAPNPNDGQVVLYADHPTAANTQVIVYNTVGIQVYSGIMAQGDWQHPISLQGLSAGTYFYFITESGTSVTYGKIIIKN